jgi:hypothetical protein
MEKVVPGKRARKPGAHGDVGMQEDVKMSSFKTRLFVAFVSKYIFQPQSILI